MNYFWAFLGWIWSKKYYFLLTLLSALIFFIWSFPFNDLSDLVTSVVARATGNQVYVQFGTLDLHFIPQPAVSATEVSIETSLPPLEAKWAKITPSLIGALTSIPSFIKAASGDPEASRTLTSKLGGSIAAEGVLGGDVELDIKPGQRSRVSLSIEKINLAEVQKWSDLSVKMQGQTSLETEMEVSPDMQEQPEGEFNLKISKFVMPATTVMVPMGEASLPVNLPTLTLANVVFKGKLQSGNLIIDEGTFGQNKDPLYGRIKGQMALRFQILGSSIVPVPGPYNLTVDLNTSQIVEKELGFAFLPLGSAKTPSAGGGAHYLFKAGGQGIGMAYVPSITRINSF